MDHKLTAISESDLRVVREWLKSKNAKCGVCEEPLAATAQNTINVFVPTRGAGFELTRWRALDPSTQQSYRDFIEWVWELIQPLGLLYLTGIQAVSIVCDNCGNIVLLEVEKIGLFASLREDQQQET